MRTLTICDTLTLLISVIFKTSVFISRLRTSCLRNGPTSRIKVGLCEVGDAHRNRPCARRGAGLAERFWDVGNLGNCQLYMFESGDRHGALQIAHVTIIREFGASKTKLLL